MDVTTTIMPIINHTSNYPRNQNLFLIIGVLFLEGIRTTRTITAYIVRFYAHIAKIRSHRVRAAQIFITELADFQRLEIHLILRVDGRLQWRGPPE